MLLGNHAAAMCKRGCGLYYSAADGREQAFCDGCFQNGTLLVSGTSSCSFGITQAPPGRKLESRCLAWAIPRCHGREDQRSVDLRL